MDSHEVSEFSCGIIPVRREKESWSFFLVRLRAGHWGFPKGHREGDEEPLETAKRELQEETGMVIKRLLSDVPIVEHYWLKHHGGRRLKQVYYFVAEVEGECQLQVEEVREAKWVGARDVTRYIRFSSIRGMMRQVFTRLKQVDIH